MRQHKTALVLRLAALAISILPVPAARAADDLVVAEPTAAAQPMAVEQALERQDTATLAQASDSAAADLQAQLVCSTSDLYNLAIPNQAFAVLPSAETIVGIASFYDEPQQTASGEPFDPNAFTAAAQLRIRDKFGGIRFGRKYQPAYAVAEYRNKKLILKFNDVGPLRPGRKFDLSRAAMAYFGGLKKGLLPNFKVTPLPLGQTYRPGPVTDAQLAALEIGNIGIAVATAQAATTPDPGAAELEAPVSLPAEALSVSARLYALETTLGEG